MMEMQAAWDNPSFKMDIMVGAQRRDYLLQAQAISQQSQFILPSCQLDQWAYLEELDQGGRRGIVIQISELLEGYLQCHKIDFSHANKAANGMNNCHYLSQTEPDCAEGCYARVFSIRDPGR